jgi:2',3'-cyclic-nucleotide 2'-phosphodiesterase (5'-nucleotidase family)
MICKRAIAFTSFAIAVLLVVAMPAAAFCSSGTDIAGTVPRLLTAISDENAQCHECTLGDAVADALRIYLHSDVAIVCGGDLVRNLPPGEISWDELRGAFAEDRVLATVSVTPKQLRAILEAGLSHITLDASEKIDDKASAYGGFPQISGFALSYHAAFPPGERVKEIRIDGKRIDLDDDVNTIKMAATEFMLEGGYGLPRVAASTVSDMALSAIVARYMNDDEMADYLETGRRIYPIGARDGTLGTMIPIGIIVPIMILFVLGGSWKYKRMYDFER